MVVVVVVVLDQHLQFLQQEQRRPNSRVSVGDTAKDKGEKDRSSCDYSVP